MVVPKVAVATVIPQPAGKMAPPGPVRDRRRKTHGLYFHSSPPKVLQMNNQNLQRDNDNKTKDALVIKPANIRIWLHQKHIAKLTKVLWAGQGMRLRTETSHHPKMKRFLECVPHVMGVIKDIHQAVVDNDLDTLKERTASPTPRIVLTSKDANGLTPLHKAAGLAHTQIVEYILSIWPSLSSDEDHTGKTPLHWAASAKNNARSFNLLVQAGADEAALDHRDKPAEYYKNKPSEIDRSLLTVIPEAPRVSQQGFPAYFDWAMFTIDEDSDDSNGSRMKPFLSQNNLLDNDVNSYDSVSKSKSVHNLTNGTLTDLPNDGEGESEAKNKDSEEEEVEIAANPTESAGEEDTGDDGAVVEAEEEQQDNDQQAEEEGEEDAVINGAAEEERQEQVTNQAETEATGDRDGGDDDDGKVVTADAAAENEQTEQNIETGECEQVVDGEETGEVDDGGKKEVDVDDGTHEVAGVDTVVDDLVKSAITSAKSVRGGDGVDGMANDVDVGGDVEANGELTNDSLESDALGENGGDEEEIDQDSLNKPDEEVENGSVGNREISAQSKTGTRNSSAATLVGKGSRPSTVTISNHSVDRNGNSAASGGSRVSSAVGDNLSTSANNSAQSRPVSSSNSEQSTVKINSAASKTTIPDSAKSMTNGFGSRNGSAVSVVETNNNQNDQSVEHDNESTGTRPSSRVVSGRELSATSRAQSTSSTVRNGSASSGVDRKQQRSAKSGTSQKSRRDVAEDGDDKSDSNDDSNQADVEIIHYKSSNEAGPAEDWAPSGADPNTTENDELVQNEVKAEAPVEPEPTADDANDDDEPDDKVASPSPALEIAGTVLGEPDGGQLHSAQPSGDGLDSPNEDRSVRDVIETGDMEQLAVIVLNGEGKKLLGQRSELPEIQAFLDNVPSYMNKIRRVHVAAREGSLRDLQSALDRRKFATARDEISPHGATPLHVATIFGHSGIVRYLAGRFPETTSATDNNGRTPMHYAATLKDNGHFYNLLNHLGANPKAEDNLNHPAEYYLNHDETKDLLSHRQLLQDYGAEEDLADDMLNDQVPDDLHSARRELDDVDTLTTLERCFKIIHEPVADLLKTVTLPSNSVPGSASSLRVLVTSYLARFLKRSVFDTIKKRQTKLDHNLFDVIWPAMKKVTKEWKIDEDLNAGIVIPDYDVFVVFQEFLVPLIQDMHCMEVQPNFEPHPPMQFFPRYVMTETQNETHESNGNVLRENPNEIQLNLDTSGRFITGAVVECCRNLDAFEFPLNLSIAQLERAERILTSKILSMLFANAIGEEELGTYYTMNEILESQSEIRTILATSGLLIPMLDHSDPYQTAESIALNGRYWPYGRGVYVSHNQDLVAWINAQEHLRVMCCTSSKNPADIGIAYSKIGRAMNFLEDKIQFKHSYFLGYLTSRPSYLGTGLKITLTLELPHLNKEKENLRHLSQARGLYLLTSSDNQQSVRMSNTRSLSQCEWQIFQDYTGAITNIVALEKDLLMSNSMHIAATLLKIFRKKKNSLVEAAAIH